jgi:hypothetical protein
MLSMADDDDIGDYTDIMSGRDITVDTIGPESTGTAYNKSSVRVRTKQTPLSENSSEVEKWLDDQKNPIDMFKKYTFDEIKDFLQEFLSPEDEAKEGDIIDDETSRLNNLGYDGDVMDKMFKSARYYFRKKSIEKKQPRQRRQYISVNRELLNAMDNHIEENIFNTDYQPKTGFISFCKENEKILKETIAKFFEQDIKESELIEDKIKKTYKNRYFMLTQIKNK